MTSYASVAAYLAHWRSLRRTNADAKLLSEMNGTIDEILGAEQQYFLEEPVESAARRHRDRAEAKLRRELIARGVIAG